MGFFEELDDLVGQVGDIAKKSVNYYGDIIGMSEDYQDQKQTFQQQQQQPSYQPIAESKSNLPLFILVGLILLIFFLRK